MAVATKLTWEEFEKLPDDGRHHELLEGEHIALTPPRFDHSAIADRILTILRRQTQRKAYVEAGYRLGSDSWVQPDVSIPSLEQLAGPKPGGYLHGAPDLAVEVVSPSETAAILDRKVRRLLAAGESEVWVVYPETRTVHVFRRSGSQVKQAADRIATDVLPGWEANVADFFAD